MERAWAGHGLIMGSRIAARHQSDDSLRRRPGARPPGSRVGWRGQPRARVSPYSRAGGGDAIGRAGHAVPLRVQVGPVHPVVALTEGALTHEQVFFLLGVVITNDDVEPYSHRVPKPAQGLDVRHAATQLDAR